MKVGMVGLPFSGKTMLFEAITGARASAASHDPSAHMATVAVPDERLDKIAESVKPDKITYAHVDFVDVAGVGGEMKREQAVAILSSLRNVDGLVHVVRWFESPSAPPHPHGSLDPKRDAAELHAELIVADLDIVERRMEKLQKQIAKFTNTLEHDKKELALLQRLREALEEGKPVSALELTSEESLMLRAFQFLSEKPMLYVLNVHEDMLNKPEAAAAAQALGPNTVIVSARAEKDIAELEPEERAEFLHDLGITEPAARRVIQGCYRALGLRSFFTAGETDCRAWTVSAGDSALIAAGKIHSDIARGFIRAEVYGWKDFEELGDLKAAKAANRQRLEGKEYEVQDGDIMNIRFKV